MGLNNFFLYLLVSFLGFAVGRIGHILGGHLNGPHHWIPALVLILAGIFNISEWWAIYSISFGIGLFISDLKDFLLGKVWGVDDVEVKKFWGID